MDDDAANLFRDERRATPQMPLSTLEVVMGYMKSHTANENARIDSLQEDVRQQGRKIDALTESINAWMDKEPAAILEKCEVMFDEAIPTARDNPDATPAEKRKEHRRAHAKWMEHVEDELARWKRYRQKAADWMITGVLTAAFLWIVWSIKQYFGIDK